MRPRLVLLAAVAFGAWSGASGLGSAATAAPGGGTSASVQGSTVTITVHADLCCTKSASEATVYGPLIQEEVTQAQSIWNAALAKLPVNGCVTLRVAFDVRLRSSGAKPDKDYHQIQIDFTKMDMSFSNDPVGTPYDDTTSAYTKDLYGEFYDADMTTNTWAHELGHLMGLGDDYSHGGFKGPKGQPLPGRDNTMMADKGPHTIDQNLADRLADIASRAKTKMPGCPWTGTIESDSQRIYVYSDGGGAQCNDRWHSDLSFAVKPDATVTGTGTMTLTSGPTCSGKIDTANIVPTREIDFSVSGTKQKGRFTLTFGSTGYRPPPPAASYAGITTLVSTGITATGPPLTIPITRPCTAGGPVATSYTLNSDTFTASNVFALKCKGS